MKLKNVCLLVQKGDIEFLWDTGISDDFHGLENGQKASFGMFTYKNLIPLSTQLQDLGLEPKDIDFVALSHFHDDHVGNLKMFKNAKILAQKSERDSLATSPKKHHFNTKYFSQINYKQFKSIEKEYDVFDDEKVVIMATPGHTPGHQSLKLKLNDEHIFVTGDLFHFDEQYETENVPVFNSNKELTQLSMQEVKSYIKVNELVPWILHDENIWSQIKKTPKYYNLSENSL